MPSLTSYCCPLPLSPSQRRTASSYMIWMNAEGRAQAKERYPEAKVTEVAKYCGETWHNMSSKDKVSASLLPSVPWVEWPPSLGVPL
jgi:hypothetical protein